MKYLLINPNTNNLNYVNDIENLKKTLDNFEEVDAMKVNYLDFVKGLKEEDEFIIAGGDGTINYVINAIDGYDPICKMMYYPAGTGNDFYHDIHENPEKEIVQINKYIKDLPIVEVNGIKKRFLNGIGYGIDGYCCEVGDSLKGKTDKPINYAGIAIKGLLFHFKKKKAIVTVDGITKEYNDVWLVPSMKGRYYGGGMDVAPNQDRLAEDKLLSAVVFRGKSKIHTLMVFPSIFKGEHVKHTKMVYVMKGSEIEVKFNEPCALQIDGETVLNVTSYKAYVK